MNHPTMAYEIIRCTPHHNLAESQEQNLSQIFLFTIASASTHALYFRLLAKSTERLVVELLDDWHSTPISP